MSHQGGWAVLAFDPFSSHLGIDISLVQLPQNTSGPCCVEHTAFFTTMRAAMAPAEWSHVDTTPSWLPQTNNQVCSTCWRRLVWFMTRWAVKESFLKALGIGLGHASYQLHDMEVHFGADNVHNKEVGCSNINGSSDQVHVPSMIAEQTYGPSGQSHGSLMMAEQTYGPSGQLHDSSMIADQLCVFSTVQSLPTCLGDVRLSVRGLYQKDWRFDILPFQRNLIISMARQSDNPTLQSLPIEILLNAVS